MDRIGDFQYMSPSEYSKGKVPWCLQPEEMVETSDAERQRLEEQRNVWLQLIDDRITSYENIPINQSQPSSPLIAGCGSNSNVRSASHRVFGITELLEKILRHANHTAHLIALGVCHKWKNVALHIMKPSSLIDDFTHAYPCPPVQFGDPVPQHLNWLPATTEDFDYLEFELEENFLWTRDGIYRGMDRFKEPHLPKIIKTVCYPGRITMAPNASPTHIASTKGFYFEQLMWNDIHRSNPYHRHVDVDMPEWVDLTQFVINDYFASLFQDTFEVINGVYEISLQPSCPMDRGSTWDSLPPAAMSYLATQFVTQPPAVSLNVSTWIPMIDKPRVRRALHIVNVRNHNGIRVSELLAAMKAASGLAVEHWKYWASLLRNAVKICHSKQDVWVVDGKPKLVISLDPFVSGESRTMSLHYLSCMHALPSREKRQGEWLPRKLWCRETTE